MTRWREKRPPARRRRRRSIRVRVARLAVIGLVTLLIAAGVGIFILTRSPVLVSLIEPELSVQLGAEVTIGAARVAREDLLILEDVAVFAPGESGRPAEVLRTKTLEIHTNLVSLLSDNTGPLTLRLIGARLRMSEDRNRPGTYSFMSLRPRTASDEPPRNVTIELHDGVLEVGTHDESTYEKMGELPVKGSFHVRASDSDWLNFLLNETDANGRALVENGLRTEGRINLRTFAHEGRVTNLAFDDRFKAICPTVVRAWWETLELAGTVASIRLHFEPDTGPSAEIEVADVGLTIPFLAEDVWGLYQNERSRPARGRPRMRVDQGTILLVGDHIELDNLRGRLTSTVERLVGVPYRVDGSIGPVPPFEWEQRSEWVDGLVNRAPLNLQFAMDDFEFAQGQGERRPGVELPVVITRIFEQFKIRSCRLETRFDVTRAASGSAADSAGPPAIMTSGSATLSEGEGAYAKFPYPLRNVSAELEFTQDDLRIMSLLGEGRAGGTISISGRVWPLGTFPNVELRVSGSDLPLTKTLRDAFFRAVPRRVRRDSARGVAGAASRGGRGAGRAGVARPRRRGPGPGPREAPHRAGDAQRAARCRRRTGRSESHRPPHRRPRSPDLRAPL